MRRTFKKWKLTDPDRSWKCKASQLLMTKVNRWTVVCINKSCGKEATRPHEHFAKRRNWHTAAVSYNRHHKHYADALEESLQLDADPVKLEDHWKVISCILVTDDGDVVGEYVFVDERTGEYLGSRPDGGNVDGVDDEDMVDMVDDEDSDEIEENSEKGDIVNVDEESEEMETEGNDGSMLYKNNPPCICGQEMVQMAAKEAYDSSKGVVCDLCSSTMKGTEPVFHCNNNGSKRHNKGYDLCFECGWKYIESELDKEAMAMTMGNAEDAVMFAPGTAAHSDHIQTETLIPLCICGEDLAKTDSTVYGPSNVVLCDNCNVSCKGDDVVWHLSDGERGRRA